MKLGEQIKEGRKQKGLSQVELAKEIGITQASLSAIESGKAMPKKHTLESASKAIEVPLAILFWNSIEESDIPTEKREAFELVEPVISSLVNSVFKTNH